MLNWMYSEREEGFFKLIIASKFYLASSEITCACNTSFQGNWIKHGKVIWLISNLKYLESIMCRKKESSLTVSYPDRTKNLPITTFMYIMIKGSQCLSTVISILPLSCEDLNSQLKYILPSKKGGRGKVKNGEQVTYTYTLLWNLHLEAHLCTTPTFELHGYRA